jgi:hypothetical protein
MHSFLDGLGRTELQATEVNALGELLDLSKEATLRVAQQLRDDELITFDWGGAVKLTSKGRDRAMGKPKTVTLGEGSVYVAEHAHISHSAIGAGASSISASGKGASVSGLREDAVILSDLVAGLQALRDARNDLNVESRSTADTLEGELVAVLTESKEDPSQTVEEHLDRAKGLLERLGGITQAVVKLGPVLNLIRSGLGLGG